MWARSTNKSKCQVCRRVSDPDKMLLCDECNGGTHMFCMKPKMKKVPEGNWYCARCVSLFGLKNETVDPKPTKRKRKFVVDVVEKSDNESDASDTSSYNPKTNGRKSNGGAGRKSKKRKFVEEESDNESEISEASSYNPKTYGRKINVGGAGRRSNKRLASEEIEQTLNEDDNNDDEEEEDEFASSAIESVDEEKIPQYQAESDENNEE